MRHHTPFLRAAALAGGALTLAGAAFALDYPPRKPGLWEMSISQAGATTPPHTVQQCIDAATDSAMREMGQGLSKEMCSKKDLRSEGGKLVVDSVCKIGASTSTSHAVVTGDFGSAYHMESKSTYSPPLMGKTEATTIVDTRWVGPCKPDQKPGDMMMGNGMKMNVMDMMGAQPKKK